MPASKSNNGTITLVAGGDIGPAVEQGDRLADLILPVLRTADLRFGQCERIYSERGGCSFHPRLASIWKAADIDVISMASNHTMDFGPDAFIDTLELFRGWRKHVIGAGRNIAEARKPAIIEMNGVRVAFLAYCSVLCEGYEAGPVRAGAAPMRAHAFNLQDDYQPGTPPRVITIPHDEDLHALQEDIAKAKQQADAVVMSIHWGIHHMPKTIADYQPVVAHAAIDAGADLILGHHAHCIKAVEVYKGKVCFYSLGNYMTTSSQSTPEPLSKQDRSGLPAAARLLSISERSAHGTYR